MLQKFGFSQYESQAYEVVVSSNEPLDATTIVKHSGVPKAKIYEVLARLIDKGMVMDSVSEKKKMYTALPLKLAIEKLTTEFQSNIKELETTISKKSFTDDRVWSLKCNLLFAFKVKNSSKMQKNQFAFQLGTILFRISSVIRRKSKTRRQNRIPYSWKSRNRLRKHAFSNPSRRA